MIRRHLEPSHHASASSAIGAVVDSQLRMTGVDGLRVVDASVMPEVNGGNTTAAATMIAEKATDLLLERATLPPIAASAPPRQFEAD